MKIEEFEKNSSDNIKTEALRLAIAAVDEVLKDRPWETVFTTRTVDDFLFGYEDSLLKLIHDLKPDLVQNPVFGFSVSITSLCWLPQSVIGSIWH